MISTEQALQELWKLATGKYVNNKSYTCEKKFVNSFPIKDKPPFILDGLPKQIGGSK